MTVLAIDTSESHCSAALLLPDGGVVSKMEDIGRGHAERLMPMVEELLTEKQLEYSDLRCVSVVTGPGTFTGLRIGLSVARGLALALDIPCVGLMSLPVLAAEMAVTPEAIVHVVTKGRGGQVFYQSFEEGGDGLPKAASEAKNIDVVDAETLISERPGPIGGSGLHLLSPLLVEEHGTAVIAVNPEVLAHLSLGLDPTLHAPEPTYLRQADAVKAKAVFQVRGE